MHTVIAQCIMYRTLLLLMWQLGSYRRYNKWIVEDSGTIVEDSGKIVEDSGKIVLMLREDVIVSKPWHRFLSL